jgi:hypothetical protein
VGAVLPAWSFIDASGHANTVAVDALCLNASPLSWTLGPSDVVEAEPLHDLSL